jgi:hypothetical protein
MKLELQSGVGVVVLVVGVLGGCHAVLPLDEPWLDNPDLTALPADGGSVPLDLGNPPDVIQPDLIAHDQEVGPKSYYEDFELGLGDVSAASSTCVVDGGKLTQQSDKVLGVCGTLFVPYDDYRVEATVTVEGLRPDPLELLWQGAGIGVRVQDTGPPAEETPGYYACIVTPDGGSLSVAFCKPLAKVCEEVQYEVASINLKAPYKLRASVIGDSLVCEIPGVAGPLGHQIKDYTTGAVSLVSLAASAAFDDLSVEPL